MPDAKTRRIGIILNGVTGRMGSRQHLMRSIMAIIREGGIQAGDAVLLPDPILVGRDPSKLAALAKDAGGLPWSTDLDALLDDARYEVYFDAQTTDRRAAAVREAIAAGKHVYCEKPSAGSTREALELYRLAKRAGVKHGVVQDKLWLPGILHLRTLIHSGFFGRILAVRGEFGYWVFEGHREKPQRPSWNYRKEDGGGIILDMLCHWRYLLDDLFGGVEAVSCLGATHVPERIDEAGRPYACTADDAAYATFLLRDGVVAQFNSSWCTRVRRDDLLTIQVDGTAGSAVAGLRTCWIQPREATPRPVWNPDEPDTMNYLHDWTRVPDHKKVENAFKAQWTLFLRHVAADEPFRWDLLEGARGVHLAELGLASWAQRRWVEVPLLEEAS